MSIIFISSAKFLRACMDFHIILLITMLNPVFVVGEVMCLGTSKSSSDSIVIVLNAHNICFMLNKSSVELKVFSSNVAVTSDSIVTANGSIASTCALMERILGERMCA